VVLVALGRCGDGRATITRQLAVLAERCAALGRDPAEIEKTVSTRLGDGEWTARPLLDRAPGRPGR
jgi:hypothetical protein